MLEAYLPQRLGAEEIAAEVKAIAAAVGAELGRPVVAADMGRLLGAAKARLAGKADMSAVSAAVKAAIAG